MDETIRVFGLGERRLTMLLVGYWQEARDGRRCPLADDFTALVPEELLADCFTYRPPAKPPGPGTGGRIADIGAALARVSGISAREMALDEAPPNSLLGVVGKFLDLAIQEGTPVLDDGEFEDKSGARQLYRATLLPMENEDGEIDLVIGGARCRAA